MSKFKGEFAAHKDCQELFVVNGMPFLKKSDAENFQRGTDHKIEVVKRPGLVAEASKTSPFAKMKKDEVVAALEAKGVDFDPKAKKDFLVILLAAATEEE